MSCACHIRAALQITLMTWQWKGKSNLRIPFHILFPLGRSLQGERKRKKKGVRPDNGFAAKRNKPQATTLSLHAPSSNQRRSPLEETSDESPYYYYTSLFGSRYLLRPFPFLSLARSPFDYSCPHRPIVKLPTYRVVSLASGIISTISNKYSLSSASSSSSSSSLPL